MANESNLAEQLTPQEQTEPKQERGLATLGEMIRAKGREGVISSIRTRAEADRQTVSEAGAAVREIPEGQAATAEAVNQLRAAEAQAEDAVQAVSGSEEDARRRAEMHLVKPAEESPEAAEEALTQNMPVTPEPVVAEPPETARGPLQFLPDSEMVIIGQPEGMSEPGTPGLPQTLDMSESPEANPPVTIEQIRQQTDKPVDADLSDLFAKEAPPEAVSHEAPTIIPCGISASEAMTVVPTGEPITPSTHEAPTIIPGGEPPSLELAAAGAAASAAAAMERANAPAEAAQEQARALIEAAAPNDQNEKYLKGDFTKTHWDALTDDEKERFLELQEEIEEQERELERLKKDLKQSAQEMRAKYGDQLETAPEAQQVLGEKIRNIDKLSALLKRNHQEQNLIRENAIERVNAQTPERRQLHAEARAVDREEMVQKRKAELKRQEKILKYAAVGAAAAVAGGIAGGIIAAGRLWNRGWRMLGGTFDAVAWGLNKVDGFLGKFDKWLAGGSFFGMVKEGIQNAEKKLDDKEKKALEEERKKEEEEKKKKEEAKKKRNKKWKERIFGKEKNKE